MQSFLQVCIFLKTININIIFLKFSYNFPGGVGFDINCGVRLIRTNLTEKDVAPLKEELAQSLFDHIPVGVGSQGVIPTGAKDLNDALVTFFL